MDEVLHLSWVSESKGRVSLKSNEYVIRVDVYLSNLNQTSRSYFWCSRNNWYNWCSRSDWSSRGYWSWGDNWSNWSRIVLSAN